jgi:beta-glucosidase
MSVKQGGATGVMSSFNRVGTTWCGASYPLCTTVLRNEWGFRGSVLTDFYMNWGSTYANAQIGVLAGNDLYLNPFQHEALTVEMINSSNQLAQAAKTACKNALYMTSRGTVNTMVPVSSWRSIWLYGNVAAGVVFVASVIFLILGIRKSKHQGTAAQIEVSAD